MKFNDLENKLNVSPMLKFRLYSLTYVIKRDKDAYIIYSENYEEAKKTYYSLKKLVNDYMIYNENIKSNLDKIDIVE